MGVISMNEKNENVKYSRAFTVVVYVDKAWLTNEFEDFDEEAGWKELEYQIKTETLKTQFADPIRLVYDGWTEEPMEENG